MAIAYREPEHRKSQETTGSDIDHIRRKTREALLGTTNKADSFDICIPRDPTGSNLASVLSTAHCETRGRHARHNAVEAIDLVALKHFHPRTGDEIQDIQVYRALSTRSSTCKPVQRPLSTGSATRPARRSSRYDALPSSAVTRNAAVITVHEPKSTRQERPRWNNQDPEQERELDLFAPSSPGPIDPADVPSRPSAPAPPDSPPIQPHHLLPLPRVFLEEISHSPLASFTMSPSARHSEPNPSAFPLPPNHPPPLPPIPILENDEHVLNRGAKGDDTSPRRKRTGKNAASNPPVSQPRTPQSSTFADANTASDANSNIIPGKKFQRLRKQFRSEPNLREGAHFSTTRKSKQGHDHHHYFHHPPGCPEVPPLPVSVAHGIHTIRRKPVKKRLSEDETKSTSHMSHISATEVVMQSQFSDDSDDDGDDEHARIGKWVKRLFRKKFAFRRSV